VWGARSSGRKWPQVALVAAAPFFTALLIGALLLKASSLGSGVEELVQRGTFRSEENVGQEGPCLGSNCTGMHAAGDAAAMAAAGSANTGGAAGGAAASGGGSSASEGSGSGAQAGQLPRLFLFIGILSGRGYRHRRLAVREAWANKAQTPGQVVAKFILSENEHTPPGGGDACRHAPCPNARATVQSGMLLALVVCIQQAGQPEMAANWTCPPPRLACPAPPLQVEKELQTYGDMVFAREKTNYQSILHKTFMVRRCSWQHGLRAEAQSRHGALAAQTAAGGSSGSGSKAETQPAAPPPLPAGTGVCHAKLQRRLRLQN
jgi:hypothetical protein